MSLYNMSVNTPSTGSSSSANHNSSITFDGIPSFGDNAATFILSDNLGRYDSVNNGMYNCSGFSCSDSDDTFNSSNTASRIRRFTTGYIPVQTEIFGRADYSANNSTRAYCPSPYINSDLNSGNYNKFYGTTEFDDPETTSFNSYSDFRGIVNTKIITDSVTYQQDWKTSETILVDTNNKTGGCFPGACCCARYKPLGTKAFVECSTEELYIGRKFWYLPSIGELGYIPSRIYDIDNTITRLIDVYNVGVTIKYLNFNAVYGMQSSSIQYYYNSNLPQQFLRMECYAGFCNLNTAVSGRHLRAFMRL